MGKNKKKSKRAKNSEQVGGDEDLKPSKESHNSQNYEYRLVNSDEEGGSDLN